MGCTSQPTVTTLSLSISPPYAELQPGESRNFTLQVIGGPVPWISWATTGGQVVEIDGGVTYTAPLVEGDYQVVVTADSGPQATARIVVSVSKEEGDATPKSFAGGWSHSLAVLQDGTLLAWGDNQFGQLGNGTTIGHTAPALVSGLGGVRDVSASWSRSVALRDDGTVWVWGSGQSFEGPHVLEPVQVGGLGGAARISAGPAFTLALLEDGSVRAWGQNIAGVLGNGTKTDSDVPVLVIGLSGITRIAAGAFHALALRDDGSVWAWGENISGQLGVGGSLDTRTLAVWVSDLDGIIDIAAGSSTSTALRSDGSVWQWGGYRPSDTTEDRLRPRRVDALQNIVAITQGDNHTLALRDDGTIWAWGLNHFGQLGDGSSADVQSAPVQVSTVLGAVGIFPGGNHSFALTGDGAVWAWGSNASGQLGDGTTEQRRTPVRVHQ